MLRVLRLVLVSEPRLFPAAIRVVSGAIFVAFGQAKFTEHAKETASFTTYGLPEPEAFVYAIGALELSLGLLLVLGLGTRLAALGLAGNMVGAIATAGRVEGGFINLGLAPALLVAMLVLVFAGAGRFGLDARIARRYFGPG